METPSDMEKNLPAFIRFLRVVIVLVIAIGVAAVLIRMKEKPEKKDVVKTPPAVKIIEVQPESKVMTVDAFGTVKARKQIKIVAEVPGRIDYIHPSFTEGGQIKKGDLLIRIDQRSYELDRQAAEVKVRQAKTDIESLEKDIENLTKDLALSQANVDLAQKEFERIEALSKNQFASKTVLDRTEQQYLQSKIAFQNIHSRMIMTQPMMDQRKQALSMAQVNFEKADLAYKKARITAPFSGWVLNKMMEKGDYVNPGQMIGIIYEKESLDVDVSISMENMQWIEPLLKNGRAPEAQVSLANIEGTVEFVWSATLARFKANFDEKTRTLPMTLEIKTADENQHGALGLKPGAFVKCSIQGVNYDNIFVLPRYLLKTGDIVFKVNGDSLLEMKKVSVLRKLEEAVFIDDGLNPGDKIIVSPLPGALEGMKLTIKTNGK